jgi:hypothetical protein
LVRGPIAAIAVASALGTAGCVNGPLGSKVQSNANGPDPIAVNAANGNAGNGTLAGASLDGASIGLGSGWLVGARKDLIDQKKVREAQSASERSRRTPATLDDVRRSDTADLNGDGFVTLDEIEAMQKSGLSDSEIIDRLQRTGQVFQLDERQQDYLKDRGVSQRVIDAIRFLGRNSGTTR